MYLFRLYANPLKRPVFSLTNTVAFKNIKDPMV